MSAEAAAPKTGNATGDPLVGRDSATFLPTVWGDHFLHNNVDDSPQGGLLSVVMHESEYEVLKEEVKRMVTTDDDGGDDTPQAIANKLRVIDVVQRLGVGYHFETEIEGELAKVHALGGELFAIRDDNNTTPNVDLYHAALWFRILRQQGFQVSPDVFRKLKDTRGRFKEWLASDVQVLLSLYEAAHVAVHGEDILDEALDFATKTLKSILPELSPSFQKQVNFSLGLPAWKCVPRTLTRNFIDFYFEDPSHNNKLLQFAKLDFNMLQKFHQQELREISEMDVGALETLPDTMKDLYHAIIKLYDDIEIELGKRGPTFAVDYAKGELKKICRAYLAEVHWRAKGYIPTLEEYKLEAYVSGGLPLLCTSTFIGMEPEIATREAFEWVTNEPKMVRAVALIGRFQNDIVSHEFERERKHAASAIECYMKEHSTSKEEAIEFLWNEISKGWKDIAEECQKPTPLPVVLTDRVLNFARSISVIYEKGDGYTDSNLLKAHIAALFAVPVPL
ncbi:unnamed protein product [Linum tenue]|uniref:Uncharacterized protein n=1 Tax=Linum tenue TaxID=586396 RepID=A0AAV0NA77_9ROSI|nr:unnamed protein product [Linum tenue]